MIEAWGANCRMNLKLIDNISDEGLNCTLSKRGGRGVLGELAHMHTNRVWQLEKRAPDLGKGLVKYTAKDTPTRAQIRKAFIASDKAMQTYLVDLCEGKPKRRGFRRGLFTTLAYFVSHESHHRGRILLTLKVSGETLDKDAVYSLWGWDQI
ncbi:MAG: hypothetical protein O7G85_13910 [Planctomycetota bacterium]|nr:hypothetical protein [Planctomycetota bacterium]